MEKGTEFSKDEKARMLLSREMLKGLRMTGKYMETDRLLFL